MWIQKLLTTVFQAYTRVTRERIDFKGGQLFSFTLFVLRSCLTNDQSERIIKRYNILIAFQSVELVELIQYFNKEKKKKKNKTGQ